MLCYRRQLQKPVRHSKKTVWQWNVVNTFTYEMTLKLLDLPCLKLFRLIPFKSSLKPANIDRSAMSTFCRGYPQCQVHTNCKLMGQSGTELNDKTFMLQFGAITCGKCSKWVSITILKDVLDVGGVSVNADFSVNHWCATVPSQCNCFPYVWQINSKGSISKGTMEYELESHVEVLVNVIY